MEDEEILAMLNTLGTNVDVNVFKSGNGRGEATMNNGRVRAIVTRQQNSDDDNANHVLAHGCSPSEESMPE